MNPVIKLLLLQATVFVAYITFIWIKYRVQDSISDSWYALKKHSSLFTFFIWAIGIPMCVIGGLLNYGWYFFSGGVLCFVGAAADYKKNKMTERVHVAGAIGGIALALIGQALKGIWFPTGGTLGFTSYVALTKMSNRTWWIEIVAFLFIEVGLIYEVHKYQL